MATLDDSYYNDNLEEISGNYNTGVIKNCIVT